MSTNSQPQDKNEEKSNEESILQAQKPDTISNETPENTTEEPQVDAQIELKNKLEEEKTRRLQVMADFDNYKKRLEAEKAVFGAIANMGLIREILEVSDDMGLALDDESLSLEAAKDSIKSAQSKIYALVKNAGVEKIEVKKGDSFDKESMEAIQAISDPEMVGKVIAVISSAYKYADRDGVIKAAKVIVGK